VTKYSLNPENTLAILIGISKYTDFKEIAPAPNNVKAFAAILKDKAIFGIPEKNIKQLIEGNSTDLIGKLLDYTEDAKEKGIKTLILYFAGHGYRRSDGSYFLAANDTKKRHINIGRGSTALPYDDIKKIIENSRIGQSIILLDACYSGLATQGEASIQELDIKGGYTITSSDSKEVSYFDTDEEYTLFTGELLNILKNGLPVEEEKVSLNLLYQSLRDAVKKKNPKMSPQQKASKEITGDNFNFFKNKKFDKTAITRRTIWGIIKEADTLCEKLDFDVANKKYQTALRKARPARNFEEEIEVIHNKMDSCEEKGVWYHAFKKKYQAFFDEELNLLKTNLSEAQTNLKSAEQKLRTQDQHHNNQVNKLNSQINQLKEEIEIRKKEISGLKANLTKKENIADKLLEDLKSKELHIRNLTSNIENLEKEIKQLQVKEVKIPKIKVEEFDVDMVFVKGGTFKMGEEKETHEVTLSDYYSGKYAVTQKEWQEIMGNNPSNFKGESLPVETVSWNDVQKFIEKLNKKTGKSYRLLTEAEWEFAARGGNESKGFTYSGSNQLKEVGWYGDNSKKKTHPVGELESNELGIFDMSGNVLEWCENWYGKYENRSQIDPKGAKTGSFRVLRGGGWGYIAQYCRVSYRHSNSPDNGINIIGFRLAHSSSGASSQS
jgi:formylglycine-generating enzyme required for sulfatase activity